ncbi:hypothetical protein RHS01_08380 [Rhizoctonia solani]|uniref:Uncharacterized protein n=1 Tax=Rhizoctonia solani TaxID=456999 RepID=A0A8H7I915_9AGAM|nr:hypothetical protein RHS01_08380 [Rhizoctonia solani]
MPYAYATGETRAWTTRDERELKAEHKRATRATLKHLEELKSKAAAKAEKERPSGTVDRSFMDRFSAAAILASRRAVRQAMRRTVPARLMQSVPSL